VVELVVAIVGSVIVLAAIVLILLAGMFLVRGGLKEKKADALMRQGNASEAGQIYRGLFEAHGDRLRNQLHGYADRSSSSAGNAVRVHTRAMVRVLHKLGKATSVDSALVTTAAQSLAKVEETGRRYRMGRMSPDDAAHCLSLLADARNSILLALTPDE